MCELFGLSCNDRDRVLRSSPIFVQRGSLCQDGWGIGYYEDARAIVERSGESITRPEAQRRFFSIVERARSRTIIAHVRFATSGAPDTCNSHPLKTRALDREWIFAHNGVIEGFDYPVRSDIGSEIDSAKLFSYLIDNMERYMSQGRGIRGIYPGLKNALRPLIREYPNSKIDFLLSDGTCMFPFNHNHKPIYYLKRIKDYGGAILLTTIENLSPEDWKPIPKDKLLVICNGEFLVRQA